MRGTGCNQVLRARQWRSTAAAASRRWRLVATLVPCLPTAATPPAHLVKLGAILVKTPVKPGDLLLRPARRPHGSLPQCAPASASLPRPRCPVKSSNTASAAAGFGGRGQPRDCVPQGGGDCIICRGRRLLIKTKTACTIDCPPQPPRAALPSRGRRRTQGPNPGQPRCHSGAQRGEAERRSIGRG